MVGFCDSYAKEAHAEQIFFVVLEEPVRLAVWLLRAF